MCSLSSAILRFECRVSVNANTESLRKLTEMMFYLIDRVSALKLSAAVKKKALTARQELASQKFRLSHEERQEQMQLRKEEQLRKYGAHQNSTLPLPFALLNLCVFVCV